MMISGRSWSAAAPPACRCHSHSHGLRRDRRSRELLLPLPLRCLLVTVRLCGRAAIRRPRRQNLLRQNTASGYGMDRDLQRVIIARLTRLWKCSLPVTMSANKQTANNHHRCEMSWALLGRPSPLTTLQVMMHNIVDRCMRLKSG